MPFKPGENLNDKNHKFNPNNEHRVEVIPLKDAIFVKTAKGKIISKSDWHGQPIVEWAKTKKELE